jgi:hypothetical protein
MNIKAQFIVIVALLWASLLYAQILHTNEVDQAQVIKLASQLRWGITEKEATDFLKVNGLRHYLGVGSEIGWTDVYILSNGRSLDLEIGSPIVIRKWKPGQAILMSAWIAGTNGATIVSISLTNGSTRPETNSTSSVGGSR